MTAVLLVSIGSLLLVGILSKGYQGNDEGTERWRCRRLKRDESDEDESDDERGELSSDD